MGHSRCLILIALVLFLTGCEAAWDPDRNGVWVHVSNAYG